VSPTERAQPFDEKAALAELERLRESIQAARQARQRSSDEFDAFVKSFRKPSSTPISERPIATEPASQPPSQPAPSEAISRSPDSPAPPPVAVAVQSNSDAVDERILPASTVPRRNRISLRSLGILAIIAVIALGLFATRWRAQSPPKAAKAANDNALARNVAVPPPAAAPSAPATPAARAVAIELRVIRPVWMRVVVDGRKDVEGTVQTGEPLHFTGERSIVVRVGNGGDVLVKTGDREEPFGDAAQPRTRTFSKP
jgi:hypothetical protein